MIETYFTTDVYVVKLNYNFFKPVVLTFYYSHQNIVVNFLSLVAVVDKIPSWSAGLDCAHPFLQESSLPLVLGKYGEEAFGTNKQLFALTKSIMEMPNVKAWIEKRPQTQGW